MNNISIKNMSDCFGCGICFDLCPTKAITMQVKSDGAEYPIVDVNKCINCGLCLHKCPCKDSVGQEPKIIYAAAIKDDQSIKNSASGGLFYILAKKIIQSAGVVYGAAYKQNKKGLTVEHIRVNTLEELQMLQGSKYVQSRIYKILPLLKKDVLEGKKVLFSGTPCQVSAVYSYLGKEYSNLCTVEIICHGAPGTSIFEKYTQFLSEKYNACIDDFRFRDKTRGWGYCAKTTIKKDGYAKTKILPSDLSSYYAYFLSWSISREGCYSCHFAKEERIADITLGDFNGIKVVHPEFLLQNGGVFEEERGISCVLVNSLNGINMFDNVKCDVTYVESDFEHASRYNQLLLEPCKRGNKRTAFFDELTDGWKAIEKMFVFESGLKYIKRILREWIKYKNRF